MMETAMQQGFFLDDFRAAEYISFVPQEAGGLNPFWRFDINLEGELIWQAITH